MKMSGTRLRRSTILYVDHTAKIGGGEIALLNLIGALNRERFHPIVVLASDGPLVSRLRQAGVETHVLPLDSSVVETRKDSLGFKSLVRFRQAAFCIQYAARLARFARTCGADLIHTNSLKADVYGGLAGRLARIPVIWHVRDNIDEQYLPPRVASVFRSLCRVIPQVVVANSESTLQYLRPAPDAKTAVVYSGVVGFGERECVVHDGFNLADFPANGVEASPIAESSAPVIALVGRIAAWKGQHVFLQAAAQVLRRFPKARFWIVGAPLFGEHDYERSLHALTQALGIGEQVRFWGFRDDVAALLARVDVVVHASTLGEPFGQVVIEGMAAGKPVIATDGGALPEIVVPGETGAVVPGETGLLVALGDADAMARAIACLLADPIRGRAMGAAGRQRVQRHFTIAQTARNIETIYEQMLKQSQIWSSEVKRPALVPQNIAEGTREIMGNTSRTGHTPIMGDTPRRKIL